jgi:hypothetical protein
MPRLEAGSARRAGWVESDRNGSFPRRRRKNDMRFDSRAVLAATVLIGALVPSPPALAQEWARNALESSPRHQE